MQRYFSQTWYFYHKTHIKWDVIISSLLRLLLKVWIWWRCQNRIKNYCQHNGEQLSFYKRVHIKRQHRAGCSLSCKKRRIPIYLAKSVLRRISNAIFNMKKVDLDESSLNRKNYYFTLIFPERNFNREKVSNRDVF